jgi:hypothetical protein
MRRIPFIRVRLALGATALAPLARPAAASADPSCQASGSDIARPFGYCAAGTTF